MNNETSFISMTVLINSENKLILLLFFNFGVTIFLLMNNHDKLYFINFSIQIFKNKIIFI